MTDDDGTVTAERTLPSSPLDLVLYGPTEDSARVYIDAQDIGLWLSLVLDQADQDEEWIVRKIRDELLAPVQVHRPRAKPQPARPA